MDTQPATATTPLLDAMNAHNVSIRAEFVPFSKSRNANEKHRSLNWRVTLVCNGRDIVTTDYSAGEGHCPYYRKHGARRTNEYVEAIAFETENGRAFRGKWQFPAKSAPILPDPAGVVASFLLDSSVLDARSFEDWANELGCDPDSRAHEAIYRACMATALQVRNGLPAAALVALTEAARDF